MQRTIFEIGLVLSENVAAIILKTDCNVILWGSWAL